MELRPLTGKYPEWNVEDAYVLDKNGKKIIDFKTKLTFGWLFNPNDKILKKDLLKNLFLKNKLMLYHM